MARTKSKPPALRSRRWVAPALVTLVVLVAAGLYFDRRDDRASRKAEPASTALSSETPSRPESVLSTKVILPAIPRSHRPRALPPEQFTDPSVRKAYEVARDNPALLEKMPCYCGCYANPGHTNNLDCFVDKHGET